MVRLKALASGAGGAEALPLLLGLLLSACTLGQQMGGPRAAVEAAPPPASKPKEAVEPAVDPRAAPQPEQRRKSDGAVLARRTGTEPEKKPARPPLPPLSLKSLVGLDQNAATALVGQPSTVAEQPPAIIWEYRDDTCALKLSFFFEVQQKSYRVLTVKVEGTDGSEVADQACLDTIRDRKLTQN